MSKTKIRRVVLSVLLIAVVLVGTTVAYLTVETQKVTNPFSFLGDDGIDAELEEPNWDSEDATLLVPGSTVPKDPLIYNSGVINEYVGMKLTFRTTNASNAKVSLNDNQMKLLLSLINFEYETATAGTYAAGYNPQWLQAKATEEGKPVQTWIFVGSSPSTAYSHLVPGTFDSGKKFSEGTYKFSDLDNPATMATVPIFDRIIFKTSINNDQYAWLNGDADYKVTAAEATALGIAENTVITKLVDGFEIYIEGAGVQQDVFVANTTIGKAEIVTAIYGLLNP